MFLKKKTILLLAIYEQYGTEQKFEDFLQNLCSLNIITSLDMMHYNVYYEECLK